MTSTYHTPAQAGIRAARAEAMGAEIIAKSRRQAERTLRAVEVAEHLHARGYHIDTIDANGLTIYSDTFEQNRDGLLNERAEREVKQHTRALQTHIKSIYVDCIRPEGLVRIDIR